MSMLVSNHDIENILEGFFKTTEQDREKVKKAVNELDEHIEANLKLCEQLVNLFISKAKNVSKDPTKLQGISKAIQIEGNKFANNREKLNLNDLTTSCGNAFSIRNRADTRHDSIRADVEKFLDKCSKGGTFFERADKLVNKIEDMNKIVIEWGDVIEQNRSPKNDDAMRLLLILRRDIENEIRYTMHDIATIGNLNRKFYLNIK